jgi:hypothetical protein
MVGIHPRTRRKDTGRAMMEKADCHRCCGLGRKTELSVMDRETDGYDEANGGILATVCW